MRFCVTATMLIMLLCTTAMSFGDIRRAGDEFVVSDGDAETAFSAANGSILRTTWAGDDASIVTSGEFGLWQVKLRDGTEINAGQFSAGSQTHRFTPEVVDDNVLRLAYDAAQVRVVVSVEPAERGVLFSAQVTPRTGTLMDFALPARLRFSPDTVEQFICPMSGSSSVGTAFNKRFFGMQPTDRASGWWPRAFGPDGYKTVYGGPLDQREDQDPATGLTVTPEGLEWLGASLAGRAEGAQAVVNRPPTREQAELILLDSANGPYLSANHLGGEGYIWRLGGSVRDDAAALAASVVSATIERLAQSPPAGRTKIGLVALHNGPQRGGWSDVTADTWLSRLGSLAAVTSERLELVQIATPEEMLAAAGSDDFLSILNPYGEWAPVTEDGGMPATVAAVSAYVKSGGNWFEVGGYPFYYEMHPLRYLSISLTYPAAFADFFHLDSTAGSLSIYRIQPQNMEPWVAAQDKQRIFIPGRLACGGDETGGWCDRPFATFIEPGETWQAPNVALAFGRAAGESLLEYAKANGITRRLDEKMSPETLEAFKQSVLFKYNGICSEKLKYLDLIPSPSLVHYSDYLKGGFDKQYPDHLPPGTEFGTPEQFREFHDRGAALGHLMMPYTNPTWWCYDPKGPTFEREGDAPLLHKLDGNLSHERYGTNPGYTVCHWHPAVQAANRETVRQFTEDYPVGVLFQDQCGARGWQYDTNPASPTVYAYSEGLQAMIAEDCRTKPLSTESGWDRVVNFESQLCGMSWGIVPTEGGPSWRTLMKEQYPPDTWEVFPVAQYIAHDKCAMVHHDLGQFVTNRQVLSWTLGIGFNMSYTLAASALTKDAPREWLRWLDRVQKSVCARYTGEPVTAFKHDRGPDPTTQDDGVIRAQYGEVEIVANLSDQPRTADGHELAPYGFYITAPGLVAANLQSIGGKDYGAEGVSFISEETGGQAKVYLYAPEQSEATVLLPDGERAVTLRSGERHPEERISPPADLARLAPKDWPNGKPAIGIIDLGAGVSPSWTAIKPSDWYAAFSNSPLAKQLGAPVQRIGSIADLYAALKAGPTRWLCIINPYGETLPVTSLDGWRDSVLSIKRYVDNGGCWWETGGYSFHGLVVAKGTGWERGSVGPSGIAQLGLPVDSGEVEAPAEKLMVTAEGRAWLGDEVASRIGKLMTPVNRGLPRGGGDPGHVALLSGERADFVGGYRLNGWGWLWRIGGFNPNPDVTIPATVAAMQFIYTNPPLAVKARATKYLWTFDCG